MSQPELSPTFRTLLDVASERQRQIMLRKAGRFRHTLADAGMADVDRLAALMEEVGEVGRALMELNGAANDKHGGDLRKELVQVAAVCVAWVEYLDAEKSK